MASRKCARVRIYLTLPTRERGDYGYMYESWHFRYLDVDFATKVSKQVNVRGIFEYK